MKWTPATYGGLYSAFVPQDDVWKPDVALKNSMESFKQLGVSSLNVEVDYQGHVTWYPFQVFEPRCEIIGLQVSDKVRHKPGRTVTEDS